MKEKEENLNAKLNDFDRTYDKISKEYTIKSNKEDESKILNMALKIINRLAFSTTIPFNHALIGVCALFQCGAHLKNVQNRSIVIKDTELSKRDLIYASEQMGNTYTLRTIAKIMRDRIARIAIDNKIPGHLYKKFREMNTQFDPTKNENETIIIAAYCTDFHNDNPNAPQIVREFLVKRILEKKK